MEWLLRFVTWKSSVKGVARRSEPLTATRKVRFRKEVKGVIFALNLLETWRGSVGLPVAVYLAPDPPGIIPEPLSRRLSAMSSRYALTLPLRGELRSAWPRGLPWLRAPAKGGSGDERIGVCNCVVWRCIVGIVGIDLIGFEDRLTDVYEGYESICLLTAESKYVPFSCDCAADSVQWSFEVILSDLRSLNESSRLSQTDPGLDHPENPEWGELALSWYASVSERVGKRVASRYWSGKDDPVARLIKQYDFLKRPQ